MSVKDIQEYIQSWKLDDDDQWRHAQFMVEILDAVLPHLPKDKRFKIVPRSS